MNIKNLLVIFIFLITSTEVFSQKTIQSKVLDKATQQPIEFVSVYDITNSNFVITNAEGKFVFTTNEDSIYFSIIGYENLVLLAKNINSNDIIYLESKAYQLNEVVVGSGISDTYNKVVSLLADNYPREYFREEFYLRTILKRNDSIIKIQDLNGVIARNTLLATSQNPKLKKNYSVYVNNMRKAGYNKGGINFVFFDFEKILTELVSQFVPPKLFDMKETTLADSTFSKLEFSPKDSSKITATAYYIVNLDDNAFVQTYFVDYPKNDFKEKSNTKSRNTHYEVLVSYIKDPKLKKYRIDNAKIKASVEVIDKEGQRSIYDITYLLKTKLYDNASPLRGKVSLNKNIFNLKVDYDEAYWKNNDILQLTDEMVLFLESLKDLDSKEFKVKSNIE